MSLWNAFCWNPVEMRSNWHVDEVRRWVISSKSDAEMSWKWDEASEISLWFEMLLDSGATRCQMSTVLQSGKNTAHIFWEILSLVCKGRASNSIYCLEYKTLSFWNCLAEQLVKNKTFDLTSWFFIIFLYQSLTHLSILRLLSVFKRGVGVMISCWEFNWAFCHQEYSNICRFTDPITYPVLFIFLREWQHTY